MIEVLHLIDTYRIGGPGKTIINSAKYIDRSRYRVHVGSFTDPARPERNEFAQAVRAHGIPFLDLPETRRINLDHLAKIRGYVREHGIAIVHAHGYRTDAVGYAATRFMPGVAVLTTHHGWIRNNPRQDLMARSALQLCRRLDAVQVVSRRLLDELPPSIVRRGRAAVVHNGIVLADYALGGHRTRIRQSLGVADDVPLLGVVGRLSEEKGGHEMLEAFGQIAAQHPLAQLVFVGEGPLRAALEARVHAAPWAGRVHFAGHHSPVQPFYEALDILVSPSRTEGLSNAILEALVFGRPVVATRVGGNPEIIEDGISGLFVEARRPDALAGAVLRVLDDGALRASLVAGGRARVEAEFTFEARMRKEEQFYAAVLARRGRRPD
jgi:glycosyltransferase involved in cell wall biosynthesis